MKVGTSWPSIATKASDLKFDPATNKVPRGTPTIMLEGATVVIFGEPPPPPPPDPPEPPPQLQSNKADSVKAKCTKRRETGMCGITP